MNRLFLLVILFFPIFASAQELKHYDIIDGLSSIEVTDFAENKNFLWIATCDGLNRFDGENFKIYKRENGLTENNIETLFFDSEGFLWIGLKTGGVDIYDPQKEKFSHLNQFISEKVPSRVITIMEDSGKNIWLGTWEEGLYKLTPDTISKKGERRYKTEIHYPGYIVSSIIEKPVGYIRVGTYFGAFVYNLNTNSWIDSNQKDKAITGFLDMGEDNSLWCSTWNSGLLKISWNPESPEKMNFEKQYTGDKFKSIFRIIKGGKSKIYLGTWGEGLKIFDYNNPQNLTILQNKSSNASLINCLFQDRYNNIWIGTYGGGIYKFDSTDKGIKHFPKASKLPAPATSLASFGKNQILVGTQGDGVFLCNLTTGTLTPKLNNTRNGEFTNYILSLYADEKIVLAGHDGSGLPYIVRNDDSNTGFRNFLANRQLEKITAYFVGKDGRIWIGSKQDGLMSVRLNRDNQTIEDFEHYDSFGRVEITGFANYDNSHIFISSHYGLFLFNTTTNKIDDKGEIVLNEIVYKIEKDIKNNCLWVGTSTRLMKLLLDHPDSIIYNPFPDNLLPQGSIRALTLDNNNNLWFSIGERLFCLIDNEKKIREINPDLLGNHAILSGIPASFDHEQNLVFGTTDNLILIEPEKVLNQPDLSKIVFTGLQIDHRKIDVGEKVFGKEIIKSATEYISSLKLSYQCRWISLSFAETGLDFFKNKYQYRINGFSDSWQYLDLTNPITFSHFNPGNYTFEIRKYNIGDKFPVCWSLNITITPPWWNTTWFYILILFVILLISTLISRAIFLHYKRKHLLKLKAIEKQKQEELLKEKESFFIGLSHDLLTHFSLILAPANDLLRDSTDESSRKEKLEIISRNTTFLSDIFGTILDFKRVELSDNQLKEINVELVSFSHIVLNAFKYLARSRKISLTFHSEIENLNVLTDNIKVERILYNLISNAIKYTPDGGTVSLTLEYAEPNQVLYIVKDNGVGMEEANHTLIFEKFYREPEKPGKDNPQGLGLGLYIVYKFVEILGGTIRLNSAPGKGTEIQVELPVKINLTEKQDTENEQSAISEDLSTILIVEDNDQMREYIQKKLAPNFNVITSVNGQKALDKIEKYLPEIIITDIMMPGMDGLTLCQKIKENNRYADIFVVILTAKTATDDELEGYKKGADIYIKKPFDAEILLNQMVNIHTTRQRRKSQLLSNLFSKDNNEIVFDPKETFLKHSMQVIDEHLMDTDFDMDTFADEMNMSKTVLHRKFRLLVGQTPNQFIRLVRLRKSVDLLRNSEHTIAEIAYLTGFNQSHYFIKCFREVYNETPKSFREHYKQ